MAEPKPKPTRDEIPAVEPQPLTPLFDGGLLGLPGHQIDVVSVIPRDGAADQPAGSPGKYNVVFVLSRTAECEDENTDVKSHEHINGSSYLKMPGSWTQHVVPATHDANGVARRTAVKVYYEVNPDKFLGKIHCNDINASGVNDAIAQAYRAVAPYLNHLSVQVVQPFHIRQIDTTEIATQTWHASYVLRPAEVTYTPSLGEISMISLEYNACASLYREALSSNSPMYAFLCFYSILEWAKTYQGQLSFRARERGEEPSRLKYSKLPSSVDDMRMWLADLFPHGTTWSTFALDAMLPAAARGKSIVSMCDDVFRPIRDSIAHNLRLENSSAFTAHEDIRNMELVQRWLPLAHCLVRRRLKDFFPNLLLYQAQAADQPTG